MATKDDQKVNNYHMVKTFIGQNKCIIFQWVTLFMTSDYAEARDNITTNGQRLPPLLNKKKAKIIPTKRDSCVKKKWHNIWPAGVFVWHTQYLRPLATPQLLAKTDRYSTWKQQLSILS